MSSSEYPLPAASYAALLGMSQRPQPRSRINPGVVDLLTRLGLAEVVSLPSPFHSHRGRLIDHMQPTAAGRRRLGTAR